MLFRSLVVLFDAQFFMMSNYNYNLTITSSISDMSKDLRLNRVSSSHRNRRALDIRKRDMTREMIDSLENYLEAKYKDIAAISKKTGKPNILVIESDHLHLQIHKRYSMPEIVNIEQFASLL